MTLRDASIQKRFAVIPSPANIMISENQAYDMFSVLSKYLEAVVSGKPHFFARSRRRHPLTGLDCWKALHCHSTSEMPSNSAEVSRVIVSVKGQSIQRKC